MDISGETSGTLSSKSVKWLSLSRFCLLVAAAFATGVSGLAGPISVRGLQVVNEKGGAIVFDSNNHVYWLADANLAASPEGRKIQEEMKVTGISPNGAMDYPTAQKWVQA